MMLNLFDRYVAGQLVRPMMGILVAALLVLLAERTLRVVDIVVGWRGSLLVIFEMLGYLVPTYLGLALPAALFIAILLTVGRLSRDGELDAMLASGTGFLALLRPLLLMGLLVAAANALVQSHLQPFSRFAYRAAVFTLSNVSFQVLLREGQFATLGDTTYTVDWLTPGGSSFGGLFLAREEASGDLVTITAETGQIVPASAREPTTMRLQNGVQATIPFARAGEAPGGQQATIVRFRNFVSDLKGNDPQAFAPRGEDERELTLPELAANPEGFPERGIDPPEVAAELHVRVVRIATTLLLPLVAAPLAVARRRSRRSWGFLGGVVLLLVFNQIVQLGKTLADDGRLSVAVGLWLPLALFVGLGVVLTWRRATRVPSGSNATAIEAAVERALAAIGRRIPVLRAS